MSHLETPAPIASVTSATPIPAPTEDAVREYAYHLYRQGGTAPGHDVDNWLEAAACLKANIPASSSNGRLHKFLSDQAGNGLPFSPPSVAERELTVLRNGREAMESEPSPTDSDIRTSLFDNRP